MAGILSINTQMDSESIYYDHPVTKLAKDSLQIEALLKHLQQLPTFQKPSEIQIAIITLYKLLKLTDRPDLLSKLYKFLITTEHQLTKLKESDNIDSIRLEETLLSVQRIQSLLSKAHPKFGERLRKNPFFQSIYQSSYEDFHIDSHTLPAQHTFIQMNTLECYQIYQSWLSEFSLLHEVISVILELFRSAATFETYQADRGYYQGHINASHHLIRVEMPLNSAIYPRASISQHGFSLQFFELDLNSLQSIQSDAHIEFKMALCIL